MVFYEVSDPLDVLKGVEADSKKFPPAAHQTHNENLCKQSEETEEYDEDCHDDVDNCMISIVPSDLEGYDLQWQYISGYMDHGKDQSILQTLLQHH